MSLSFRVALPRYRPPVRPATITIRQLVAFRTFARAHDLLIEEHVSDDDIHLAFDFEARIRGIALAVLARLFGYSEPAITVLEEAQHAGRRVRIYNSIRTGKPMLIVAKTVDTRREKAELH